MRLRSLRFKKHIFHMPRVGYRLNFIDSGSDKIKKIHYKVLSQTFLFCL